MWAKRKYPRTACIIVTTEESISPRSPSWRMYSSTWVAVVIVAGWNGRRVVGPDMESPHAAT